MKIMGISGTVLGVVALMMGLYLHFVIAPAAYAADLNWEMANSLGNDNYYGSLQQMVDRAALDAKTDFGIIVMGAGLLAFLVSLVPAIKKQKIAWIGVGLGLGVFFLGAAYGTHMFS